MNFWEQLTETSIAGIEVWRFLSLFMAIFIAFVAGRITRYFIRRTADHLDKRYPPVLAVALRSIERSLGPVLFVAGLRVGLFFLSLPETVAGLAIRSYPFFSSWPPPTWFTVLSMSWITG